MIESLAFISVVAVILLALFSRRKKLAWRGDVLINAETGEILAQLGGDEKYARIDTWLGHWSMGSQRYISKDDAKAAAERMFR